MRPAALLALSLLALAASSPAIPQAAPAASAAPVNLTVDLSHSLGPVRVQRWFGYDEENYTSAPNGRKLLHELDDLSPTPVSIRFHHLLTSGNGTPELKWSSTGVYREGPDGKPIYNFAILDRIFDALQAAGVRPMVEFGFMPEDLAATLPNHPNQPYKVPFPRNVTAGASNNPPRDYAKWRELVRVLTAHFVQRYGRAAVLQWYFEVWNEPDISYWHGSEQDYFRLYDFTVSGVRAALPGARVGGPATTGPSGSHAAEYLRGFLEHLASGHSDVDGKPIPLDFISFHAKGHPAFQEGHVVMGIRHELDDADQGFAIIQRFPRFRTLPVILSEADPEGCAACSARNNPANNYRNGTLYPAYTAAAYSALTDLAARHHTHLIAMLTWAFEFENTDAFEGFRSLATDGIDKPILNFFRMAGLLGSERVAATSTAATSLDDLLHAGVAQGEDIDAFATRTDRSAAILVWNYQESATAGPTAPTTLSLRHLPPSATRVLVTQYRIDGTHSNAYTVWQAMGSPAHPTPEQLTQLESRDGLELLTSPAWHAPSHGVLTLKMDLPVESVALVTARWTP
ncbi:MAG TPA: beta-xylosidase [Acidobacteriaceae bacterium]|nr:beta-xylosidase [Acidobacteriaceae bacterium]